VRDGWVHATATPIHLGGKTQVWDIRIKDDHGHLVCISRLTLAVLDKK
jgi:1,4-dihydroxy-2-naphthoyl-CoA hydrolase